MMKFAWSIALLWCATVIPAAGICDTPANSHGTHTKAGLSCASAIVIHASNEIDGVDAENRWLASYYPGWQLTLQALSNCNGKPTDLMTIASSSGESLTIYFDISLFFGKEGDPPAGVPSNT